MFHFFKRKGHGGRPTKSEAERHEQARRILDLEAALDAANRQLQVAQAEIEALAAVIERDRRRVKAETAELNLRIAQAEGDHAKR